MDHIGRDRYIDETILSNAIRQYAVGDSFANHLRLLLNYKIVIIADDSGSMNTVTTGIETRWSELCKFVSTVFSITQSVKNSFVDIHFLNRESILGIERLDQIVQAFDKAPAGITPLVAVLEKALAQPYYGYTGRLIIIATDGEPNKMAANGTVVSDIAALRNVLVRNRTEVDYVTFLACTNDEAAIGYLNNMDKELPRLDVMDDYISERLEVIRAQGMRYQFSYGDYVIKTVVGSIVPSLDKLDEIHEHDQGQGQKQKGHALSENKFPVYYPVAANDCCNIL